MNEEKLLIRIRTKTGKEYFGYLPDFYYDALKDEDSGYIILSNICTKAETWIKIDSVESFYLDDTLKMRGK